MSVDVSTLQIKVVSDGIKEASSAIGGLSTSANNAEKRVDKLTSTIQKLVGVQQSATAIATGFNSALTSSTTAATSNSTATSKLLAAVEKLNDGMMKLVVRANDTNSALDKIGKGMGSGAGAIDSNTASLQRHTMAMKDAHAMARGLTGSLGALWLTYGNMIPLAAGAAIGASFKGIVTIGSSVEHTLEGIRVRGVESVESINAIRDSITQLGQGVYGPREVAKAFDTLVMAGLNAKQAMGAIRDALNLATVGGTSIEKAAETLVQVGTALNIDANAYNRISDVIAMTAAASMSSVESVSEAFKSGSVVGKLYGATLEDIGTSFAMLSNLGIKGSAAGTALKNFYSVLQSGSEKVTTALKALGMTVSDFKDKDGNFLPLVTVFEKLSNGLDNVSLANQKLAISMLSNERGAKEIVEGLDMIRKTSDGTTSSLEALRQKIADSYGFTAVGAAAMAMTVESQFKSVKNTFETQLVKAFQGIQPELTLIATNLKTAFNSPEFVAGIQGIATGLANLALWVTENIKLVEGLLAGFMALKALTFIAGTITTLAGAFGILTTALEGSRVAALLFQTALGPVGLVIGIVTALIVAYKSQKEGISDSTKAAMNYMDDFNSKLKEEADRLNRQTQLMREGKTATEAQTQALREQQLALVALQGQKAIDEAGKGVEDARARLNPKQKALYESALTNGQGSVEGGLSVRAVNDALVAQKAYTAQVDMTKQKLKEAADQQQAVVTAAKENAKVASEMNKSTREGGNSPLNVKVDKSALAKANAELEKYQSKMVDLNAALKEQQDLNTSMRVLGPDYEKLGKGAREVALAEAELAAIRERAASGQSKATDAARAGHLQEILAIAQKVKEWDNLNQVQQRYNNLQKEEDGKLETRIKNVKEEADSWKYKAEAYGQVKGTAEELAAAELRKNIVEQEGLLATMGGNAVIQERIDKLKELLAQQERLADNKQAFGELQAADKARASFDKLFDKGRALEFGNDFANSFGKVGKAIDGAGKSMDKFWRRQKDVNHARDDLAKATNIDDKERAKMSDMLTLRETRNNVEMYADMTSAAKSFFSEKTAAYKIMDAVEKGLRVVQLGMAMEEAAIKLGLIEGVTIAKGAAATEEMTIDSALTADSVTNSGIKAEASLVAGVAKAFEQLGIWGFIGAAAIIAFLVAMGVGGGGGGGAAPDLSKMRQEKQGTGTVLGDDTAKSESVTNALDAIKDNTSLGLEHSGKMLMALRNIDNGIKSMAAYVAQTSGLRGTAADQKAIGVGSSSSMFGFSKSSTTLLDSGLTFDATKLASLLSGGSLGAHGYQDIQRNKSSFFGLSNSSSTSRALSDVDAGLQRQIDMTIRNLASGTLEAATALGENGDIVKRRLQEFVVDIGDISLKGLTGDDIEKELSAAFGRLGDQMANAIMPGYAEFQRLGEGGFDTLMRLANGVESAKKELDNLGVSMIAYQDIVNKQGDVDVELIRQSVALKEAGSNISDMMMVMDGSAQDLIDTYRKLVDLRSSLRAMGLANDVSNAMLRGAESLDALLSNVGSFMDGFYTDAEKQAVKVAKLREQFTMLGVAMPTTAAGFRTLVETLMRGGERTQDLASRVLALSDAFQEVSSAAQEAHDSALSVARDDLSTAYENESKALEDTIDKMKGFIDSLKEFKSTLIMGDMSPLSTTEKYATALSKYNETYQKAMGGDAKSIEDFQNVANQLLQFSREMYASGGQYTSDFQNVLKNIDEVMGVSAGQVDTATQQLNTMKDAVGQLIDISENVKTVAEAMTALQALMTGSVVVTAPINGSHADGLANVPFDGYIAELHKGERVLTAEENQAYGMDYSRYTSNSNDALVSEIKALRAEVVSLKDDQRDNTNRMIGANYDANERNAQEVVDGIKTASADTAYAARTQPILN
jgi:TP901 family phage tail tape measure protein